MAVAVNTGMPSNAGVQANPGTSQSYSFTNTAGTVLYATVCFGNVGSVVSAPVATYGGVSMALIRSANGGSGTESLIALFRLLSPATGANTFTTSATFTASSSPSTLSGLISFTGNDPVTPEAQSTTSNGVSTAPSVALAGVVAGNYTLACAGCGSGFTGHTQTLTWTLNGFGGNSMGNGYCTVATTSGSVTHGYTTPSDSWACVMVEVAAPAAVAVQPPLHPSVPFMSNTRI